MFANTKAFRTQTELAPEYQKLAGTFKKAKNALIAKVRPLLHLAPLYEQVAREEEDVVTKVEADEHKDLGER